MMRHVGWIRILVFLCAAVWAAPMIAAQNPPNRKSGANAGTVYRQQPSQRPAPAAQKPVPTATAAKTVQTVQPNVQRSSAAAQSQLGTSALKPSTTNVRTNVSPTISPYTPVPAQTPAVTTPTSTPSPGVNIHSTSGGQTKGSTTTSGTTGTPATGTAGSNSPSAGTNNSSSGGTSDGPTGRYGQSGGTKGSTSDGNPNGTGTKGSTSDGNPNGTGTKGSTSDGNPNGSKTTGSTSPTTDTRPPYKLPSRGPKIWPSPAPRPHVSIHVSPSIPVGQPLFPGQHEQPPVRGISQGPVSQPPVAATPEGPPPSVPASSPGSGQQPPPATPDMRTPTAASPVASKPEVPTSRPGTLGGGQGVVNRGPSKDPVLPSTLTLRAKTDRPVVGKDVVVVAALEPSRAGASYRLNWGDGSPVEIVDESGRGTHRYAKAKPYTVSASAVVDDRELNHEVLVKVGPVAPRIDWMLAALAGLAALFLHFPPVPKLTASCRWGAPGVPEMKLLSREPYLSLSFEPGVGPAEGDISFAKKRRKSGLEQG